MERTGRTGKRADGSRDRRSESDSSDGRSRGESGRVRAIHREVGNQAIQEAYERGSVRAKLSVSRPTDPAEREAERVADAVVRADSGSGGRQTEGRIDASAGTVASPDGVVGRVGQSGPAGDASLEDGIRSLTGDGRRLPRGVRAEFGRKLGHDFADVRIHTGDAADSLARSIDAEAFTHGSDIVFRAGAYSPRTRDGKRLLAHELTHVVQNASAGGGGGDTVRRQQAMYGGGGFEGEEHPLYDKVFAGGESHLATKEWLVGKVETAAANAETLEEAFDIVRAMSTQWTKRYILCRKLEPYGGVLDLKHFFYHAGEIYSGQATEQAIKIKTGLDVDVPGSRLSGVISGHLLELNQWWNESESAFSAEDKPSNELGRNFGVRIMEEIREPKKRLAPRKPSPHLLPELLGPFLEELDPIPPSEFDTLDPNLNDDTTVLY